MRPVWRSGTGDLLARGSSTFDYDAAHRLIESTVAGTTVAATYDGDGVRISTQVDSDPATTYLNDVGGLPVVLDDGTSRLVWGPAGLAWTVSGTEVEVPLTDRLGSVRTVTDESGAVVATARTDEYGVPTVATGSPANPYGFTGEPVDSTGLVHLRARSYDPDLGRFTSRDTWPGAATASQAQNRYAYLANDPLNGTDPSGHCGVDVLADAAFVVFDLGSLVFGPDKDRGTNAMALGADIASVFVPCAAGAGMLVRAGAHVDDVADVARGVDGAVPAIKAGVGGGQTAGRDFPRSVRNAALEENQAVTGGTPVCVWCHMETTSPHIDHARPKSLGGDATLSNAQVSCPHCNTSRGNGAQPITPPAGYEGRWPPSWWP